MQYLCGFTPSYWMFCDVRVLIMNLRHIMPSKQGESSFHSYFFDTTIESFVFAMRSVLLKESALHLVYKCLCSPTTFIIIQTFSPSLKSSYLKGKPPLSLIHTVFCILEYMLLCNQILSLANIEITTTL